MAVIFLSEQNIADLIDMPAAIEVVQRSFRATADGKVDNIPRQRAKASGIVLHIMAAAAEYLGFVGWKCYTTTRSGARFHFGLYEAGSGSLVALMEADRLGWFRTAATSAVAIKHLSPPNADALGLFGTGWQARGQLLAAASVRPIKRVHVYSRSEERRAKFAAEITAELGIDVRPVDQPRDAVAGLPLVITATTSRTPVFSGSDLAPGTTVCAMGSNWLEKAEIDVETIRRTSRVVCDNIEACRHEAGDLVPAVQQGVFNWSRALELADVVAGKVSGRTSRDEIIVFKSVGLAMEDVALAATIYERAKDRQIGTELPI